jgi:response regulator RpfG family c-di-GMP phosphodiesterase
MVPAAVKELTPILVVDDEPAIRRILISHLERDRFVCYEAGSGNEAQAILEHVAVPLIVSDLRMPDGDGQSLLEVVVKKYPTTAVIILTGDADVATAVSCLRQGATDYLTKPFRAGEVEVRIDQALETRRLRLELDGYRRHLEDRVAEQTQKLADLFLTGVQALVRALEVKDPYTRGHSERVAAWSAATALELGLAPDDVRQVELGGHLHDLGKIGVREGVLTKTDRLDADEYEHVMQHPELGWRILSPLLREAPVALAAVRSHHERFDGKGRPDGLVGTNIPLSARIVAIADAFDVMTTGRPYRDDGRVFTAEAALMELRRASGSQFDADLVRTFGHVVVHHEATRQTS